MGQKYNVYLQIFRNRSIFVQNNPIHLPMGWSFGCPVTDDDTMTYLDAKLKDSKKPVLLWIYY